MKAAELEKKLGKKKKTTSELTRLISTGSDKNPNFCLFVGSGASRSSGIRTAGEMTQEWRAKAYKDLKGVADESSAEEMKGWLSANAGEWYEQNREYASLIQRFYPLPTNRRKFIETEVADKIPSIGYAYLVRIAEAGLLRTIFTTNFDDLLNEAFYQFSSERALVCAHDSSVHTISVASHRTKIIKLHGDYLFDNLKNTEDETRCLEANMREKLGEFLKEYGLIVAGYSGSDKSITRILEEMCGKEIYLRNGLFWCFRGEDEVTSEALEILKREHCFYVITPGFDELLAEFYSILSHDSTPFNSKLASDRASNIIESYLQNSHLKSTSSLIIRKHLEALTKDKNASLLSDLMKALNADRIAASGLTDKNLLVILEIERALRERNPELALRKLGDEIDKTDDTRFKELLLSRRFFCSARLNRFGEAKEAAKQLLSMDPANYFVALNECSLIEKRADRIEYLKQLKAQQPYSAPVLNQYAEELKAAVDRRDQAFRTVKPEDIIAILKHSIEVYPSLDNQAWRQLCDIYSEPTNQSESRVRFGEVVNRHLAQDANDSKTTALLLRYCRKFRTTEYNGRPLFDYIQDAYRKHFPRDYAAHLEVYVDACIEFDAHRLLRPLLEEAKKNIELKDDSQFATIMMDVHYDVFRDLSGAISYGRDFLQNTKSTSVEVKLVDFYLENDNPQKAREFHHKLKGAIEQGRWKRLEADIFEHEGRFQDAIDAIESIPDKRDSKEDLAPHIAYLELKMNTPALALKRCSEYLDARGYSLTFSGAIINYECARRMCEKKISKTRLSDLADFTDSEMVKGVCFCLMDNGEDALKIFRQESEKRFSRIDDCIKWPAVSRYLKDLQGIRGDLLKRKRSLTDLPKT